MKDEDAPPTLVSIPSPTTAATPLIRKPESSPSSSSKTARLFVVKNRYKFWALAAILLLAFWSMFTGSVTLRWSAGNLTGLSDQLNLPTYDDLDILEVEDREKVVRHLWDLYTQRQTGSSRRSTTRLPRFWQEAFEAAYDPLSSDVPAVRNAAVSEIAKMSIRSINVVEPFPLQSKGVTELKRKIKKTKENKEETHTVGSNS
ncbi:hypothetical protein RchiOBHm_Chr6g0300851 [Rosa chinensis]|uniref:Uncharacterized protein n=1 Tax=Rosa chinensis TaxID=74649 RepID=A0A2P6PYN3_ROSCH|nr:uncharacterized protein LOC112172197 [Rosa chinensis]PRQ27019.1 hypothetical protein RchiOBHm_Chr6g0300851 [Rosa chinensis]